MAEVRCSCVVCDTEVVIDEAHEHPAGTLQLAEPVAGSLRFGVCCGWLYVQDAGGTIHLRPANDLPGPVRL